MIAIMTLLLCKAADAYVSIASEVVGNARLCIVCMCVSDDDVCECDVQCILYRHSMKLVQVFLQEWNASSIPTCG
jgi:hypothetical protein